MNALDKLGLAIANAGYTWTPEMRKSYEDGIKELEEAVLVEREACAKLCDVEAEFVKSDKDGSYSTARNCAEAIRARGQA